MVLRSSVLSLPGLTEVSATLPRCAFKLLQLLGGNGVLGVQFHRLLVVLNRKGLVAVLHVGFAKAVIRVEPTLSLRISIAVLDLFHLQQLVAEAIQLPVAKVIRVLLSRLQFTILLDRRFGVLHAAAFRNH